MKYPDGTVVQVGDLVWWDEGACLGYVQLILESPADYEAWGLDEPGIMICGSHPFDPEVTGVYHSADSLEDEGVGLLSGPEHLELEEALGQAKTRSHVGFEGHRYAIQIRVEDGIFVEWIFRLFDLDVELEQIAIPTKVRQP